MSDFDVVKKAAKATMDLQKARRDLNKVQAEEEKYLEDREAKAQARLAGTHKAIDDAATMLESLTGKIGSKIRNYRERFESFAKGLFSILDRADKMMESVEKLKETTQKTSDFIKEKYGELQEFEGKLGRWDKELRIREDRVEKLNQEADAKLEEARTIADWAKKAKRYTINNKNT